MLREITAFATGESVADLTVYLDLPVARGCAASGAGRAMTWNRMEANSRSSTNVYAEATWPWPPPSRSAGS